MPLAGFGRFYTYLRANGIKAAACFKNKEPAISELILINCLVYNLFQFLWVSDYELYLLENERGH